MTIKLDALASWKLVPQGEALLLSSETESERRIRIDLNCEDRTWVYVTSAHFEGEQFIAAVGPGLEKVEFYAGGELAVKFVPAVPEGRKAQVWVYTAELEPNVMEVPDSVSFTEIHQRRQRNPELEMMQLIARQNERRMDEKMAHLEALIAHREKINVDPGTSDGAAAVAGKQPAGGDQQAPVENPPDGGKQPSGDGNDSAS